MIETLRNRHFLYLWLAQVVSGVGDVLYNVGVMFTVFETTGSALQTIGVNVAMTLPPFLFGPFAGAIVDRYPRQLVMVLMDVIRIVLVGVLWWLVSTRGIVVWHIYLIVAGLAAATSFYKPARQAIIPTLLPARQIVAGNSLILSTVQATTAVGYLVGGFLIVWFSFDLLIGFNLVTFVIAAFFVAMVRPPMVDAVNAATVAAPTRLWRSIGDGVAYLRGHELARPLVVMEVLEFAVHGIWTSGLLLVFVSESLNGRPQDWGFLSGTYFSGLIIGAVLAGVLSARLSRFAGRVIVINAFINAGMTLIFGFSPTVLFAITLAFFFGPPMALRDVAQDALLQTSVDTKMLGRVYAFRDMFTNIAFLIGAVVFALMADSFPIRWVYFIGAAMYLLTSFYALASRPMRRAQIVDESAGDPVYTN